MSFVAKSSKRLKEVRFDSFGLSRSTLGRIEYLRFGRVLRISFCSRPQSLPFMAGSLEIHVAGGSIGESIIIRLPNGKYGVVDCYVPSLTEPTTSPSFEFLRKK